jgi:hypothetical protein
LKKLARTIAFNTATNCWPGWGDDGIRIDQSHLQSGLTLAGLCRELVDELHLGQRARGGADWLIGALKLAAGRPSEALPDFERARRTFEVAGDTPYELMARGYIALARKADPISVSVGAGDFATALQSLRNEDSKDAVFRRAVGRRRAHPTRALTAAHSSRWYACGIRGWAELLVRASRKTQGQKAKPTMTRPVGEQRARFALPPCHTICDPRSRAAAAQAGP